MDPDSELICATTVTPGNVGDAAAAEALLAEELAEAGDPPTDEQSPTAAGDPPTDEQSPITAGDPPTEDGSSIAGDEPLLSVYGDAAYGAGAVLDTLERAGARVMCKVQPPVAPGGRFAKDAFAIDLRAGTVTCPAGQVAVLRALRDGEIARFGDACGGCPLAERCTTSTDGRTIHVGPHEAQLARARARQADHAWKADYTTTRPKVERKIAHLMRRKHGGRRARVRGQRKVDADFALLAAAVNLARLAALGLTRPAGAWAANTT